MEGDPAVAHISVVNGDFYPRPPGGGRQSNRFGRAVHLEFLSTPSGWRATQARGWAVRLPRYFYPRPPGGGRPLHRRCRMKAPNFYPRPPGGGRPHRAQRRRRDQPISIHALRVEGDARGNARGGESKYFYPRPPGGGRLTSHGIQQRYLNFYPRPPGGGRLFGFLVQILNSDFYPRPPGGGRLDRRFKLSLTRDFYPRPPGGGRRWAWKRSRRTS